MGLVIIFAAFISLAITKDINISYSMRNILNQSVVVIIVSTGAIFIYTLGSFDISLGVVSMALISLLYVSYNISSFVQQIVSALLLVEFLIYLNNQHKLKQLFSRKQIGVNNA